MYSTASIQTMHARELQLHWDVSSMFVPQIDDVCKVGSSEALGY
jgi:hypothetical protein